MARSLYNEDGIDESILGPEPSDELSENLREQMEHATRYQGTTEVVYQRLAPCPFCGSRDAEATDHYEAPEDPEHHPVAVRVVMCNVCGAMGPAKDCHQDEIAYWNERAK